ncbi:VOC family protein [Chitinophaga sancti]|uniref:Catechol 2,3-dioxygenase n=1 Tax=Chitinophaga sancti TaxID=1004 RepID=A0A1K1MVT0_9BACT|nr:VOC family protein [Chitinophaga sancti]WQD63031.1 VOC family protein [Chitinophaga sancti]WQG91344.1 VOC family protein [Chitinophaga sancti]SFW27215.1 Catechol 2,3-dioxygenase [Chitinophaga sancti]
MRLNHLNLVVSDIAKAIGFFEQHLGFTCIENRKDAIGVLTNEDKFVLILWAAKLNKTQAVSYPENFHIGFYQNDQEAVIKIYEGLKSGADGLVFDSEPRKLRDTFGFYFHFDNLMIEISVLPA